MAYYTAKLNPCTGTLQLVPTNIVLAFKAGVATQASLPLTGNAKGDARIANDTGHLYVWSIESSTGLLTDWVDAGDIVDLEWSAINGKPSSSPANIDDAVSKRHTQNTDVYLDFGGINQISAVQAKAAYDHSVATGNPHGTQASEIDTIESGATVQDKIDSLDMVAHSHSNKTILDNIQEAFTTLLKNAYDGAVSLAHASHSDDQDASEVPTEDSGISVQDALNSLEIDQHTHSNKSELDKITIGNHDVTTGNPHDTKASEIDVTESGKSVQDHVDNTSNPHSVTKTQVGLGNVDDKSEATIITDVKSDSDVASAISLKHAAGSDDQDASEVPTDASGISVQDNLDTLNGKSHTQGTDQGLDTGGANAVTAAQAKAGYTHSGVISGNPHNTVASEIDTDESGLSVQDKLDSIINPMLFKGGITLAADFPTLSAVKTGWTYTILADVTDNNPAKTNTGLSFLQNAEIAWNGSTWVQLGYSAVKSVAGKTGIVTLDKSDVGLGNVDNTSDATKNSATTTLTNKRINPRVTSAASSSTPIPNVANEDIFILTALAETATFGSPTGTPVQGQKLIIRIKDNGTARTLAWNAIYRESSDLTLPLTTILSKTMYLGFIYNDTDSKWDLISYLDNF